MSQDTEGLYDANAGRWQRRSPNSLSDFTARPAVFDLCGNVRGLEVLDIGSGEGYCSREMAARGAKAVTGVELSREMVALARQQEEQQKLGILYRQGDVQRLDDPDTSYDLVLGVFVYNYLDVAGMRRSFSEVHRVLRNGGSFVFSVPHPAFAFIHRTASAPFHIDVGSAGYYSSRNRQFQGEIHCRDRRVLPVQMIHKTFQDYFSGLQTAGFTRLPEVVELGVTEGHLELDRDFFAPVADIPLHVAFRLTKTA